ncbi:MAG TPA: hypothetical protein VGC07_03370 [Granulicella sp.]
MLLNAPEYDERREKRKVRIAVGSFAFVFLMIVLTLAGYIMGHGWLFLNLPMEHTVSSFLTALEQKDYTKAYGIWMHDPKWQEHPQKYSYTLKRFTEDWTTESDWGPIRTHHVDISKRTGTGIIVAVTVNNSPKKMFMWYERSDGTLTYPAPYHLKY